MSGVGWAEVHSIHADIPQHAQAQCHRCCIAVLCLLRLSCMARCARGKVCVGWVQKRVHIIKLPLPSIAEEVPVSVLTKKEGKAIARLPPILARGLTGVNLPPRHCDADRWEDNRGSSQAI